MPEHTSWSEWLHALRHPGEPEFEASDDPTLVAFAQIFLDSELAAFDANKRLRTDALSPLYDCETESSRNDGDEPEKFVVVWTPVWAHTDPVTGFRTGQDSAAFGSTATVAMPPDERTAALLLLVTTAFVHMSGRRLGGEVLVQGALEVADNTYRYLTLDPSGITTGAAGSLGFSGDGSAGDGL